MKIKVDKGNFDELQSILIGGIIDSIKEHIDNAKLPESTARELLENISFSVATILDGSQKVEYQGVEAHPIITFEVGNDLIRAEGNSWMHEYVFGTISDVYGE